MRIIKTLNDIQLLRKGNALNKPYLDYLEYQFQTHYSYLGDNQPIREFSLEEVGFFVVLEGGDNVRDLREVSLSPEDKGVLCGSHEYIDIDTVSDGSKVYNIGILCNNEFMMTFFSKVGQFSYDKGVEEWLQAECC